MDHFGGTYNPLSDAFHCSESLGSRRVTLVSLRRGADGLLQSYPVSWNTGISDRLGFKAKSPTEVLDFLNNPDGETFVFPDIHMGHDLNFFLLDETMEMLSAILQAKVKPHMDRKTWFDAVLSVTPRFLYTMVKEGTLARYAPKNYPKLAEHLSKALEMLLGPAVYNPVADSYCNELRSYDKAQELSASYPTRQFPRFLSIIATLTINKMNVGQGNEWEIALR